MNDIWVLFWGTMAWKGFIIIYFKLPLMAVSVTADNLIYIGDIIDVPSRKTLFEKIPCLPAPPPRSCNEIFALA